MFRRLPGGLPPDPIYSANLAALKYFINDKDQVRKVAYPEEHFQFKITDHDRFNEVHKEAFHKCLRREIKKRMKDLGLPVIYLPQLTYKKPKDTPCLPIFLTRQADLKTKKRVIVIMNDHNADLGVWAYRMVCTEGFDAGSSTGIVKNLKTRGEDGEEPGVIILNPGQYYYSYRQNRALTHESWMALPRKSLFHPPVKVHETHNLIPQNHTRAEHINLVFENIVKNEAWVKKDAELYIIGICEGGNSVIEYLAKDWDTTWSSRIKAAAWTHPFADRKWLKANPSFKTFLETRSRSWTVSPLPSNTCRGVPSDEAPKLTPRVKNWEDEEVKVGAEYFLSPTFSAGEEHYSECVFPKAWENMLDFFDEVQKGGDGYVNPEFEVVQEIVGERVIDEDEMPEMLQSGVKDLSLKMVDREGVPLPPQTSKLTEVKEDEKDEENDGEKLSIAGVSMDKDLLAKAGFLD